MASTLSSLPPELLGRIFSFLDYEAVAASRLVCRLFNELSSPYLITSVVFALRHKEITKLLAIADHPVFHKNVVELIYDASFFNQFAANDFERYRELYDIEERRRRVDPQWISRAQEDVNALDRIQEQVAPRHRVVFGEADS